MTGLRRTGCRHTSCGYAAKPAWNLYLYKDAGKGSAPLSFGHEPKMFLLHQPALLRTLAADYVHLKVKAYAVCSRIYSHKAKVTWTLIITVMSSTLYQLSYSLNKKNDGTGHTYVGLYIYKARRLHTPAPDVGIFTHTYRRARMYACAYLID